MLDQIKDPNNLGACIRSANAVGCNLVAKENQIHRLYLQLFIRHLVEEHLVLISMSQMI